MRTRFIIFPLFTRLYRSPGELVPYSLCSDVSLFSTIDFSSEALSMSACSRKMDLAHEMAVSTALRLLFFVDTDVCVDNQADSLGGDLFWAAGVSVISDIPKRPQWPVKSHLFVNAGRLDTMDKG